MHALACCSHTIFKATRVRSQANVLMGLAPGEVFVHRNVGNVASQRDINVGACLEYSVDHLKAGPVQLLGIQLPLHAY